MKKMKGVRKLEKKVNKFLAPFGVKSVLGDEFAYYCVSELVQFSIEQVEKNDAEYIKFIKNEFNYDVPSMFLFSFLHEVGHHMTMDDFEEEELENDEMQKFEISEHINEENYSEYSLKYFHCPTEIVANEWAVEYFKNHEAEIMRKGKEMLKAFQHFYKVNGVTA